MLQLHTQTERRLEEKRKARKIFSHASKENKDACLKINLSPLAESSGKKGRGNKKRIAYPWKE